MWSVTDVLIPVFTGMTSGDGNDCILRQAQDDIYFQGEWRLDSRFHEMTGGDGNDCILRQAQDDIYFQGNDGEGVEFPM